MDNRKLACIIAAGFLGVTFTAGATNAFGGPRDILVEGERIDPRLQRKVSYRDLDLAEPPGQRILEKRIFRTASGLCYELNRLNSWVCTRDAVQSTDQQVAQAIDRAKRQMAGLSVGPPIAISLVIGVR